MHIEFLVEDASGKIALEVLVQKILGPSGSDHSFRVIAYKGVGRIPKGMTGTIDVRKRILLDRLPKLLQGYGCSQKDMEAAVVVVVDLDTRVYSEFEQQLKTMLTECNPAPTTLFCFVIEEVEAWLLGDRSAVTTAYPKAKRQVLEDYRQDSICGTWELMANAVHPGGVRALKQKGWPAPGRAKCEWAERVTPLMDVEANQSESFQVFRDSVRQVAGIPGTSPVRDDLVVTTSGLSPDAIIA